jgi:cytochrome P450
VTRPPPAAAIEIIARGLPLAIIADQLGVPRSRIGDFKKWSDAFLDFIGGLASDERSVECAVGVRGRWLRSSVVRANPTW